ncbi:hypothetical protein [Pseudoalteromonas sp.]|uniref:hypothetical protein n=1 Tax=Pseudoalteromonas sp. TaxID=53249 RepID=UPI003561B6D7
MQRQPFLSGLQSQYNQGIPTLSLLEHIDLNHPRVKQQQGEAVFLEHGGKASSGLWRKIITYYPPPCLPLIKRKLTGWQHGVGTQLITPLLTG